MSTKQKCRERLFIETLRKIDPGFPPGELIDSESPDVLLVSPKQTIGIEITEYFQTGPQDGARGSFLRMQVQLAKQAVAIARAEYEKLSDIPLWIHVHWYPGVSLRKNEIPRLGHALAALVARSMPQDNPGTTQLASDHLEDSALAGNVVSLTMRRRPNVDWNAWGNPWASFIGVEADEVQAIIAAKEAKIDSYLEKCDVAWLVIVVSGEDISATAELHEGVRTHPFQTRFARAVWFDLLQEQVVTLKPRRRANGRAFSALQQSPKL